MDIKSAPFSLYDFLGYFFPGAFAVFVLSWSVNKFGIDLGVPNIAELSKASNLLPFTISAYIAGHALALTSSFTVERYYIWAFDYPSKTLLRYEGRSFFSETWRENLPKLVVALLLIPISALITFACWFTRKKLGMIYQLDALLARMVRRKITALIVDVGQISRPNDYVGPRECDYFRLVYHYTIEKCPTHFPKMQNYVALFGFNRAMSLLFVLLFWISSLTLFVGGPLTRHDSALAVIVSAALSNLFFFGFAKFYRRFSLESLMALGSLYQIPSNIDGVRLPSAPKKRAVVGRDLAGRKSPVGKLLFNARRRIFRA